MKTRHTANCSRVFANYDKTCARCIELMNGAQAREGWGAQKRKDDERRLKAIKNHDCKASKCGPVCTAFDW